MYYDDRFDPTLENDDFQLMQKSIEDACDTSSASSVNTFQKKQREYMDLLKSTDKNYHKIARVVNKKSVKIELYSTSCLPNVYIRDAIGGSKNSKYRVGTSDENLFFKVFIATGEKGIGNDCNPFYFENPEQYERCMNVVLSPETKENWHNRFIKEQVLRK
jgi:hypothetical protein